MEELAKARKTVRVHTDELRDEPKAKGSVPRNADSNRRFVKKFAPARSNSIRETFITSRSGGSQVNHDPLRARAEPEGQPKGALSFTLVQSATRVASNGSPKGPVGFRRTLKAGGSVLRSAEPAQKSACRLPKRSIRFAQVAQAHSRVATSRPEINREMCSAEHLSRSTVRRKTHLGFDARLSRTRKPAKDALTSSLEMGFDARPLTG